MRMCGVCRIPTTQMRCSRLNKKLDDNKADVTITYERGKGYALESI